MHNERWNRDTQTRGRCHERLYSGMAAWTELFM